MRPQRKIFGLADRTWLSARTIASAFRQIREINRRHRADRQHGGPIPHAHVQVLRSLISFGRKSGFIFPSYESIAGIRQANRPDLPPVDRVARSTVALAINNLRRHGILDWVHTLGRKGDKVVRGPNQYFLTVDEAADFTKSDYPTGPAKQHSLRATNERNRGHGRGEAAPSAAMLASIRAELGPVRPLDLRLPPPPRLRTA